MKLLLDQNLSRRLIGILTAEYPEVDHILLLGMAKDEDTDIWDFAAKNDYATVSKDKDFCQRSVAMGHPPKVIHLNMGNCSVNKIAATLLARSGHIRDFLSLSPRKASRVQFLT